MGPVCRRAFPRRLEFLNGHIVHTIYHGSSHAEFELGLVSFRSPIACSFRTKIGGPHRSADGLIE